jgi:Protein of unknown function with HXXEE motif
MLEIFFLLGFSLHNLEEAIWLPAWSKHAAKFHPEVKKNEFHFAVIIVTAIGCLLTLIHLLSDNGNVIVQNIYYGFILMMCLNVILPHLIATIVLKRYAPGLVTGLLLNLPFGILLVQQGLSQGAVPLYLIASALLLTIIMLALINLLFKIRGKFIESY